MSKIVHLDSIRISSLTNPHDDLPADMQMFAQLIINGNIIQQTIPVESEASHSSWSLDFGCNIAPDTSIFLITILRHSKTAGTRLLGSVEIERSEVLDFMEMNRPFKVLLNKVNTDGPLVELSPSFSASSGSSTPLSGLDMDDIGENQIASVKSPEIIGDLQSMHTQGPMDPMELWVMHERILLLPESNETRARCLNILGDICRKCYTNTGTVDALNQAVCAYTDAVRDDPMSAQYLLDLGDTLQCRFEQLGNLTDINQGRDLCAAAVRMTHDGHAHMASCFARLGICLLGRFKQLHELTDLNESVSKLKAAVSLTPEGHPDKASWLNNLGTSLSHRFQQLGNLTDLNESVSKFEAAVTLTPEGHPAMPALLKDLGNSLLRRFEQLGDLTDLNESVSTFKAAVSLMSEDQLDKPSQLNNLGSSLRHRFEQLGDLIDLNESVSTFKAAVSLTPEGHPAKPSRLNNLGSSLSRRFEQLGDLIDLNESLSTFKAAVSITAEGHPDKPSRLNNLGNSLRSCFERLGDLTDLNESVSTFKAAVSLTPEDHPDMPSWLNDLGISLSRRFERLGNLTDLNESMSTFEAAVGLTPESHPDKPSWLNNLGNSLLSRFERLGDLTDLNESMSRFKAAISLTPEGHPDKPSRLINLGNSLVVHFEQLGNLTDLNEAVSKFDAAVTLTPEGHPAMPLRLNNLGNSLLTRFEQLGNLTDLNESISKVKAAVSLTPEGHPDKPSWLNSLGAALRSRFERFGDLTDLNESVSKFEAAVSLTPEGHPDKQLWLSSLGVSLLSRFERLGDLTNLNESMSRFKDAVSLTPEGHPDKPSRLNNLGNSLSHRFERLGDLTDLNESVSTKEAAVSLTPEGHPDKPSWLNNLGYSLLTRFEQLGNLTDLNESISNVETAVSLTPEGHPDKPSRLNNLGNSLLTRFEQLGNLSDLNESMSKFEAAVALTPEGHPDKPSWLNNLGNCLHHRFNRLKDPRDCEDMLIQYSHAASCPTGTAHVRFQASTMWAHYAHIYQHPSLLHAYTAAVELVPKVAWLGLSISDRHHQLLKAGQLVREAASSAIDAHEYGKAVEWLEQGRSVIWSQFRSLRTPVDDLHMLHPKLAAELISVSSLLETSSTRNGTDTTEIGPSQSLEATAQQYHNLAVQRDKLLQQIRGLAGFEQFLLPKLISELSQAAKMGPVVLLNTSRYSCDALILIPDLEGEIIHIPLLDFTLDQAEDLSIALGSLVRGAARGDRLSASREGELPPDKEFSRILSALWMKIVKPVLNGLTLTNPSYEDPGRIWWCPTGPLTFLPIHAAGLYGQGEVLGSKLSDFLISSYTPSLSALIEGLRAKQESQDGLQLLAIAQPSALGQNPIPGTMKEIASIERLAQGVIPVLRLEHDMATVENVQNGMRKSRWAHFACHGIQDIFTPTDSALLLAGSSKLTLSDIIQLQLPHADLAFLSACQTASGSKNFQDEAVHLTAGMLLVGYCGVIGTMWSIMDDDGPQVASDVYGHLFKTSPPNSTRAAEALHLAVRKLRDSDHAGGTKSFSHWVPFIHAGV
ncbi:TPR-like protein [Mycena latifolia]|nr:TPR-like protein [Mycena latifolia]